MSYNLSFLKFRLKQIFLYVYQAKNNKIDRRIIYTFTSIFACGKTALKFIIKCLYLAIIPLEAIISILCLFTYLLAFLAYNIKLQNFIQQFQIVLYQIQIHLMMMFSFF